MKKLLIIGLILSSCIRVMGCSKSSPVSSEQVYSSNEELKISNEIPSDKLSDKDKKLYEFFKSKYSSMYSLSSDINTTGEKIRPIIDNRIYGTDVDLGFSFHAEVYDGDKRLNTPGVYTSANYSLDANSNSGGIDFILSKIGVWVDKDDIIKNGFKFEDTKFKDLKDIFIADEEEIADLEEKIVEFYKNKDDNNSNYGTIKQKLTTMEGSQYISLHDDSIDYTIDIREIEN